ncbi:MAG TPA: YoaK family protein [Myxococcaceae bacterium]|nr:YoaK family protein [Myxococcaceae bacterium]
MPTLHSRADVFSPRHFFSWMALTASAGAVNAGAYLACQQFVAHVTGTATQLALDAGALWLIADSAAVLCCFVIGSTASALVIEGRHERGLRPYFSLPLVTVVTLLSTVAVLGWRGAFGRFGGTSDQPADLVLISLLSLAMGAQNAAVASSTGMIVRTTHLTGPSTDLGLHLAKLFTAESGDSRRRAMRESALRAGLVLSFIGGAVLMIPLARTVQYLGFTVPAGLILLSTLLSFVPKEVNGAEKARDDARREHAAASSQ